MWALFGTFHLRRPLHLACYFMCQALLVAAESSFAVGISFKTFTEVAKGQFQGAPGPSARVRLRNRPRFAIAR